MRTRTTSVSLLIGCALLCLCSDARASVVRSREACGIIQAIDATNHVLTVKLNKPDKVLAIKWNRQSQFVRNKEREEANTLKAGTRARVFYRSPFFGKPFVTKVFWVGGS